MFYVLRPELAHVLGMVTDLLWAGQTLLHDWVVTKGRLQACPDPCWETWSSKMGFAPPIRRDTLGPSCDPTRISMAMRQGL